MIKSGFGRIPEDRHRQGIVGGLSVSENMIIERLDDPQIQNFGFLRSSVINRMRKHYQKNMTCEAQVLIRRLVCYQGNIQKLILARVLKSNRR